MRHPVRPRFAAALALIPLLAAASAAAAPKLEAHFTRSWYVTEVIVFLRPTEHDYLDEERLTGEPSPLAATLTSFRLSPAERLAAYALTPFARAHLTFPYLDAERLDLFAPLADDGDRFGELTRDGGRETGAYADPEATDREISGVPPPEIRPRLAPDPLLDFLRRVAEFEASLDEQSYRPLGPESFTMTAEAQALTRRAGYRILLHRRWLQPVPAREHPEPLFVQAGRRYDDGFALEGTLDVTQGRYLHFGAHLLYREPLLGQAPIDRALPPRHVRGLDARDNPFTLSPAQLERAGYMELKENRRIGTDRVSYFDHPKLGLLVRVEPVAPPPALVDAHQALEAAAKVNAPRR